MWLAIIVLGVLFMILAMALLFNPPEALIKKVFLHQSKSKKADIQKHPGSLSE